ncbi:MAG: conjugal transfer protein TraX [Defluviitaleaceae bacterium]|nr:conjugal transfer protein TraX [Defluviitaleaceae bacterium]
MDIDTGRPGYDAFFLKMVAIVGMAMQHTVLVLGDVIPLGLHFPLQLAGGLTFPIMAFLLVEGYRYTSNVKRYMGRLFLWGVISQAPYMMAFGIVFIPTPNIMFTLFISLLAIVMYDRMKRRGLFVFLFVILCIVSFFFDWGGIGPVVVFIYHIIKTEKLRRIIPPITAAAYNLIFFSLLGAIIAMAAIMVNVSPIFAEAFTEALYPKTIEEIGIGAAFASIMFPIGSFLAVPLVLRYNGERGRSMKYLFYGFYPLHLLILALLAYVIGIGDLSLFTRVI